MIIYNPKENKLLKKRIQEAQEIVETIPTKYSFITGSFLYKEKYKDIDVFILSRTKKEIKIKNKKVKITYLDFNDLSTLLYHSLTKSCIAKEILPLKNIKVTLTDYWNIINEAVPTILNTKNKFHKSIRFLILYSEYFKTKEVLDTFELYEKINTFKNHKEILAYIQKEIPEIIKNQSTRSYAKKYFYSQ